MKLPFKIIRPKELAEILSVSTVTIWRMEKKGELPPRKKIGSRTAGWLAKDIKEWMENSPDVKKDDRFS